MAAYRLRPSAAASWILCKACVKLRAGYPDDAGDAAEEGTAAHWVGSNNLTAQESGPLAPNGVVITQAIRDGAQLYYEHVVSWGCPVVVEEPMPIPLVHVNCGGTPDVWAFDISRNLIRLCDFKFGHVYVDAFENWQLLCYLFGIVSILQSQGVDLTNTQVEFSVVQPRAPSRDEGVIRTWATSLSSLWKYLTELQTAAIEAVGPNPTALVGTQCDYCGARQACTTLENSGRIATQLSGEAALHDLTTYQASYELVRIEHAIDVLAARASGLNTQLVFALRAGQQAPEHTLERTFGRETWKTGTEQQVLTVGRLLGTSLAKTDAAVTPAEARRRGIPEDLIKSFSIRPNGESKIKRRTTTQTRKLFGA